MLNWVRKLPSCEDSKLDSQAASLIRSNLNTHRKRARRTSRSKMRHFNKHRHPTKFQDSSHSHRLILVLGHPSSLLHSPLCASRQHSMRKQRRLGRRARKARRPLKVPRTTQGPKPKPSAPSLRSTGTRRNSWTLSSLSRESRLMRSRSRTKTPLTAAEGSLTSPRIT